MFGMAVREVLADAASPGLLDRLVCGDAAQLLSDPPDLRGYVDIPAAAFPAPLLAML
jgi:hypothetical protein